MYRTLRIVTATDTVGRPHSAVEANRMYGRLTPQDPFHFLAYGPDGSFCFTDGHALVSFSNYGTGGALLFTDPATPDNPALDDCASIAGAAAIPERVKVAFRTNEETHQYELLKGEDLVTQDMVDMIEHDTGH